MKLTLEFLGTFLLMLAVVASGGNPLVIGTTLALIVFLIGGLTGAFVNPALVIGSIYSGSLDTMTGVAFVFVQILGAVAATVAYKFLM